MNTQGFSLLEVLVAMVLLSAFMLAGFEVLQHFNLLEKDVQQEYQMLKLL